MLFAKSEKYKFTIFYQYIIDTIYIKNDRKKIQIYHLPITVM